MSFVFFEYGATSVSTWGRTPPPLTIQTPEEEEEEDDHFIYGVGVCAL